MYMCATPDSITCNVAGLLLESWDCESTKHAIFRVLPLIIEAKVDLPVWSQVQPVPLQHELVSDTRVQSGPPSRTNTLAPTERGSLVSVSVEDGGEDSGP